MPKKYRCRQDEHTPLCTCLWGQGLASSTSSSSMQLKNTRRQQTVTQMTAFRFCMFCLSASNLCQGDYDRLFYLIHQDLKLRWYVFQIDWIYVMQIQRIRFCFHFPKINLRWFHDHVYHTHTLKSYPKRLQTAIQFVCIHAKYYH